MNVEKAQTTLDPLEKRSEREQTLALGLLSETACFSHPDYHIWCGSMVRDPGGLCHLFYSRWPREAGFNAWVSHSEVAHAISESPGGPYVHQDVALPVRGAAFWDGMCTHNPTVYCFDGKYYLYYTGNTGNGQTVADPDSLNWEHRNNQRIGVAVADHPAGPWKRFDTPLVDTGDRTCDLDALVTSNPAITRRPDGGYLLIYKAVGTAHALPFGGPVVHKVALSDRPGGPFIKQATPVFTCKEALFPAEDPFVWVQSGRYYAILKDMDGYFGGAGRSLVQFESLNGLNWVASDPCLISDRTVHFTDGRVKQYDYLERPQIYFEDGAPRILFCAARDGDRSYNLHIPLAGLDQRAGERKNL